MAATTMERAFQVARAGQCRTLGDLRRTLIREGYDSVHAQISGGSLTRQLRELMRVAAQG